jgi:hypothetical protein
MKVLVFILFVLTALVVANISPGVVDQIYSSQGLIDHYESLFKHSDSTFGDHDMGTESDSTGYWIFGTGMSISKTYLDDYSLGKLTKINFHDSTYDFEHSEVTGTLKYTWTYTLSFIPLSHTTECKFSVGVHHLYQTFNMADSKLDINRTIDYTSGAPKLNCDDGDASQTGNTGFDWMKEVRAKYEDKLGDSLLNALNSWLDSVDTIYQSTSSAKVDVLNYSLEPRIQQAGPDVNANLMIGYNYDITLNSKTRSPVANESITEFEIQGDLTTYYFEEYFQSLIELEQEAVDFYLAVSNDNLPKGLSFTMYAEDFLYIVEGMQKFDPTANVDVGCEYGNGTATVNIDVTTGVSLHLPILCTLRVGTSKALTATFDHIVVGTPAISQDGVLSLSNISYQIDNFVSQNLIGAKVLDEYLVRRIQEFSTLQNPVKDMDYDDKRFVGIDSLKVNAGKQFIRVTGNIPD